MKTIPEFNQEKAIALKAILDAPDSPAGAMSYCESIGFLFVVACSPELINPSEWFPIVLDLEHEQNEIEDVTKVIELLIGLYNEINRQVQDGDIKLLPGCEFRNEPLDNFSEDAPIRQWAMGFIIGNQWQNRVFSQYTPADLEEELGAQMIVLSFFANRETADSFVKEAKKEGVTIASMAADMQRIFVDAMAAFAHLAHSIQQVLQENQGTQQPVIAGEKIGRNQTCPCGSGKKYKKCCGGVAH